MADEFGDPTYGRIDPYIQAKVAAFLCSCPPGLRLDSCGIHGDEVARRLMLGTRVAVENTMQQRAWYGGGPAAEVPVSERGRAEAERERYGFVHNVVAHPLLVFWPRLGAWLHDRTKP